MPDIKRAFRIFGAFRLYQPPTPSDHDWDTPIRAKGNVPDVFFARLSTSAP